VTEFIALRTQLEATRVRSAALKARLERQFDRYRDLFVLAPDAFVVTDTRGMIVEANVAASDLFGIEGRFLIAKPLANLIAAGDRRRFRKDLVGLLGARTIKELEYELTPRSGPRRVVAMSVIYGFDAEGPALRWVIRDMTERRQVEIELRLLAEELEARVAHRTAVLEEAKGQLEQVVSQIPAGVVIGESPDASVVQANDRARHLLGKEVAPARELLVRALQGEAIDAELLETSGEDGVERTVEVRAAPVLRRRRIVSAVATFVDVTERERRERAEREFVSNAAHELRTPLAAITSALEVLQRGARDDPEARETFLAHIERQCDRLNRLVPALLLLARAQMGQTTVDKEVIPIRPLLEDLARGLHPRAEVEVEVDCDPQLAVIANRTLFEQAVWNLAANAEGHTAAGAIEFAAEENAGLVTLTVGDTGSGIEPADLERIFDRFYRGEGDGEGERFGLGLAIVQEAVRAMGGSIDIESDSGYGTAARIRLPAVRLART